ncbi:MAG: cysteine hydrolase [Gammaproteobacteria bacterium]|nr:cysteine hydrolase [Gammaproteobacteria bacterium]
MDANTTALLLVGYQNDYFSPDGVLHRVIEDPAQVTRTLENTLFVIDALAATPALMITTPILFTPNYEELLDPVGILKTIRDVGAFKVGAPGGATVPEFAHYGDRLLEVPGKRGLNAFSNTQLDDILAARSITDVVLCGVVASICIDSTGRAAFERGYRVTMLSDCISGRTGVEQDFYVAQIYPLYARVMTSRDCVAELAPVA